MPFTEILTGSGRERVIVTGDDDSRRQPMSAETRLDFTPNLVVGITILLLGIALTLDRLHLVEVRAFLQYWPLLLVLFGASVAVQALRGEPALEPDGRRPRPIVNPGVVIWIAIVAMFASNSPLGRGWTTRSESGDGTVTAVTVMGRDERTSTATPFRGGQVTTVMGHSLLDLRQATLASGEVATIDVFVMWGEGVVQVPKDWIVEVQAVPVMAGIRDRRPREERDGVVSGAQTDARARVVLRGSVMMGRLVIRS
jgi:hypothetical protein